MTIHRACYSVGQVIHHKLFDYRGIIVDVDHEYQRTEEWYALMAKSKPAREQPWYHILVDDTDYMTYVAEQNIELDVTNLPINHPDLNKFFNQTDKGSYVFKTAWN